RGRAQLRSVTLFSDAHDALPDVRIEEDRLRQVVVNLTLNAIDATPGGGAVRLEAKARGAEVELRVSDEGAGVPEPLRERIFEPFFSTRADRPGGLGLSITRRIAEEAGGSVEVGDAPGGGATFCVRLPAVS
ncbi:MAG: ATP-binding protein, partial [Myxococcales bacterium]|nr:ATP-binding protein [Myxococcales bacterium]